MAKSWGKLDMNGTKYKVIFVLDFFILQTMTNSLDAQMSGKKSILFEVLLFFLEGVQGFFLKAYFHTLVRVFYQFNSSPILCIV